MSAPVTATAFSPASVGNVGVGYDILGHALAGPGDRVQARRIARPEVLIADIRGTVTSLPRDADSNTAARAVHALRQATDVPFGFELAIEKGIPLGSGLGGSAASATAAVVAANALLDSPLPRQALYPFALEGEVAASGARHGDNVGAQLLGGLVIATADRLIAVPVSPALHAVVAHPELVIETRQARAVLHDGWSLDDFVAQSACLAQFLAGCYGGDLDLIRRGLRDGLVEPRRAHLVPGFAAVKAAALAHHALGSSLSGGGPSVFAWFEDEASARRAAPAMIQAFAAAGLTAGAVISPVNAPGAYLLHGPQALGNASGN